MAYTIGSISARCRASVSYRRRMARWGVGGLLALFGAGLICVPRANLTPAALAAEAATYVRPANLVGSKVTVTLKAGGSLDDVEVIRVVEGEAAGSIRIVTVKDPSTSEALPLLASKIVSLSPGPGTVQYTFDDASKRLLPDDPEQRAQLQQELAKSAKGSAVSGGTGKTPAATHSHEKSGRAGSEHTTTREPRPKKKSPFDIPVREGTHVWPEQSEADSKKLLTEQKDYLKKVQANFPNRRFSFAETKFFIFLSDLPPADLQLYVPYMDAMYRRLISTFDLKPDTNIWLGKASVIIFADQEMFNEHETQMVHHNAPAWAQALAHLSSDGNVLISGHTTGSTRLYLAQSLVHETTHGFLWRYKTRVVIPLWVNEGFAEYIASAIVPDPHGTVAKEKLAIKKMLASSSMGGNFFDNTFNTEKYGVASNLTRYMITIDAKRYRIFLEGLKAGMEEEESLKNSYGVPRERLVQQYGRALGILNLQP
ncbi:MAG: hypothetical protein K8T25_21170 [Planctomycetia bacterium]|nr:hypothetical protein [Planctomycetia bacterium]